MSAVIGYVLTKTVLGLCHPAVLFIDVVGYSKFLINEQSELLQKLRETVWGTEQFRLAQAEGKLLWLPTGDWWGFSVS